MSPDNSKDRSEPGKPGGSAAPGKKQVHDPHPSDEEHYDTERHPGGAPLGNKKPGK